MRSVDASSQRGQALALFALFLTAMVLGVGVVVEGGYGFAQHRKTQNAADFAAMAGTRIVAQKLTGQPPGSGTAANVQSAIDSVLTANQADLVSAQYVDEEGYALGSVVGAGAIPSGAFGVVVEARSQWPTLLLGTIGVSQWQTVAQATAITPGESVGGSMLPLGIEDLTFDGLETCPITNRDACVDQKLTSGSLNIPGGFGWLKFGINNGNKCDWGPSLGMKDGGCESSKVFLDEQIGPPGDSWGCCTAVGLDGSVDRIGSLTGNEWGDLGFYIDWRIPFWVPIYDYGEDTGANGWYHIVGFGAIVVTGDNEHARWLEGAAIEGACLPGTEIEGSKYCSAPGGAFNVGVTGEVQLVR